MQKGLLYHNLYDKNTREYILQIQMKVGTKLSENFTEKARHLLMLRYEVLRSSFAEKTTVPLQIVRKKFETDYLFEDYVNQDFDKIIITNSGYSGWYWTI